MGQAIIEFNQALQLSDFNLSSINNHTFSIWIDKASVRQAQSFFTWNVNSIDGDTRISLQLSFISPLSISINVRLHFLFNEIQYDDYLNIEILDLSLFKPSQSGRMLLSEARKTQKMRKLLPRQMKGKIYSRLVYS